MLTSRPGSRRAHLRSHCGRNAGTSLSNARTAPDYTVPHHFFRVLLLERLALPLPVTEARCKRVPRIARSAGTPPCRLSKDCLTQKSVPHPLRGCWQ